MSERAPRIEPPDKPPDIGITEAQRLYDIELVKSMRDMAVWISARSRKVADALNDGASRIDALSSSMPIIVLNQQQPASTPE